MRVFVYEFVTGGGAGDGLPMLPSLLAEGTAMAAAVTADFASCPSCEVVTTRDGRLMPFHDPRCEVNVVQSVAVERKTIERLGSEADWTLVIAPETDGILLDRARWALDAGATLLSPNLETIRLTSDKQATCEHLRTLGILAPAGSVVSSAELKEPRPPKGITFPAVLKPIDGCGSTQTHYLETWNDARLIETGSVMRLEQFIPGKAASVAVLCGTEMLLPLPACEQQLSQDGRFTYLGGRVPLSGGLDERAQQLALAAIRTLPQPRGYLGVDLVLGEEDDGSEDYVIEINPRLTTSYVGLRAISRSNLAAAMLDMALGLTPALSWRREGVEFLASGQITQATANASPTGG